MRPAKKFNVPGYLIGRPVTLAILAQIKDRLQDLSCQWDLLSPELRLERVQAIVELANTDLEEFPTICSRLMMQRYAADIKPIKRKQKKAHKKKDSEADDSGYEGSSEETDHPAPSDRSSEVRSFNPNKHVSKEEFQTAMENARTRIRELEEIIQARNAREDNLNARILAMREGMARLSAQDREAVDAEK